MERLTDELIEYFWSAYSDYLVEKLNEKHDFTYKKYLTFEQFINQEMSKRESLVKGW